MSNNADQKIVLVASKSAGISFLLTFLFGPLGMLYSTIMGGIIMFFVTLIVGFLTFGLGAFFTWPVCIIWGIMAVNKHNKTLVSNFKLNSSSLK